MTITELVLEAVNERITEKLCEDCPSVRRYPATTIDPPCEECPAEWDPSDRRCVKHEEYLEIRKAAEDVEEALV